MDKENHSINQNSIMIKGDLQKIRLQYSPPLPKIIFQHSVHIRSHRNLIPINPIKIFCEGNTLASIDDNGDGWLMTQKFDYPVNLSELIRNKISQIYLGEKELIAYTKKGFYLVNWGSKKLLEPHQLAKQNIFSTSNFDSLFQVYSIPGASNDDIFQYTPQKKADNSNRLYHFDSYDMKINGFPTGDVIEMQRKILGISVGQNYCLCWDSQGQLYSWGSRSIGLGYVQLPTDDLIETPTPVKIGRKVFCAYAASHYSLALTQEGILYEWGIKKDVNEINQEPIFKPRPLKFQYFNCKAKFVALKGRENNFAALSSSGQLYVWGATAKKLISDRIKLPSKWKGNYLFEPVLQTQFIGYHIYDFALGNNFLAVAAGIDTNVKTGNDQYWSILKEKARRQLDNFKKIRISTESEEVQCLKKKYQNSILNDDQMRTQRRRRTEVRKMVTSDQKKKRYHSRQEKNCSQRQELLSKTLFKKTAPVVAEKYWKSPNSSTTTSLPIHRRQASDISDLLKKNDKIQCNPIRSSQVSGNMTPVGQNYTRRQKFSELYQLKLNEILEKKKSQEELLLNGYIKKIAQGQFENKLKKKEEELKVQSNQEKLQKTLHQMLVKSFLAKFIVDCSDEGRELKIQNFSKHLVIERVERNIRSLFSTRKARFSLSRIKSFSLFRYLTFIFHMKKYIRNFKKRKCAQNKKKIVAEFMKMRVLEKVSDGMASLRGKIGRLHKLKEWIKIYEAKRLQALKEVWNNFVMYTFKLKDGGQLYFNQADPDLSLQKAIKSKIEVNPFLRLDRYMKFTSSIISSEGSLDRCPIKFTAKKKNQLKMYEEMKIKCSLTSQILPFSLHYNIFRKPKHLDLNVGEASRNSAIWIQIQRKTFQEHLKNMIQAYSKEYIFLRREYEVDLANFIARNYQSFYEKRWKYILEYNKVQKSKEKTKREAELKRLLGLVGMTQLFQQDCIPQKHMVLVQALKRRQAPVPPSLTLHFALDDFQESFKTYVEKLKSKIRLYKKNLY